MKPVRPKQPRQMCGLNVVEGEPEVEDEDALFREMFMGDDAVRMPEKERVGEEVFQRSEDEAEDEEIMRASDEEEFEPVAGGEAAPGTPKRVENGQKTLLEEMTEIVEEEEGRKPRMIKVPLTVSKKERDDHNGTHTPFRIWCRYCVKGRAHKMAHMKIDDEDEELKVPRISMDYFYMSRKDEKAKENPLLVAINEDSGEKYARAIGNKGLEDTVKSDWLIRDMAEELQTWGHAGGAGGKIILKCDNEKALVAFRNALGRFHGGTVIPDQPAKGESQSNGRAEEAGKIVREFARVLKEQMEEEASIKVAGNETITLWMVRWAAMICSRYLVGKDGRTGFERRRGRKCRIPVVPFGEWVWYRQIRKGKNQEDKLESEMKEGVWLGHARNSNEVLIGTDQGVVRAYDVKRKPEDQRWNGEAIKNMKGTPQQPDPSKPGSSIPIRVTFDETEKKEEEKAEAPKRENEIRRMRITKSMLEKYGHTDGCEGCRFQRSGVRDSQGQGRGHSERCRKRIMERMDQDEEGRRAKERDKERIDNKMAVMIEEATRKEEGKEFAESDGGRARLGSSGRRTPCSGLAESDGGRARLGSLE